jgi:anti-anti-sigma factor
MTSQGTFREHVNGSVPVVECVGEIDLTNVQHLHGVLQRAAMRDAGVVIVSLVDTTYLDSQGVRALLEAADRLALTRQRLLVVAPPGTIPWRILEIAGIGELGGTYDSLESAMASVRPRSNQHQGG